MSDHPDWDEVRLSVAIQHTPSRDDDPVYQCLREALPDAEVITDPGGPDSGYPSTWRTYAECLRQTPRPATHRLVLQDDVCLCTSFLYGIKTAIKARPDKLLSFFISLRPDTSSIPHLQAMDRGETWSRLDTNAFIPTQALAWPTYLIGPALRYAEAHPIAAVGYEADDQMVARFCRERGIDPIQSCPSLVEHVHHSGTSLTSGENQPGDHRAAAAYIGDYHPVDDVNWTTGAW